MYYHPTAFKDACVDDRTAAAPARLVKPVDESTVEWLDIIAMNQRELERARVALARTELVARLTARVGGSMAGQIRRLVLRIRRMLTANAQRLRVFSARLLAAREELRRCLTYRGSATAVIQRRASVRASYGERLAFLKGIAAFLGLTR